MSKVLGIIAEYNPFHNGHLYHLQESKKIAGATYAVAIITGNFVQRGDTSIVDKWQKAQLAIEAGIDLVIELPVLYSLSSAENFANGAIKILDSIKIVDNLAFGAEAPNIRVLDKIATVLYNEPKEFKALLAHELNSGLSFPKARENALIMYLSEIKRFSGILSSPNNILGIEYLKALKKYNSQIVPTLIKRNGSIYNDESFENNIASATAIRKLILKNDFESLSQVVPMSTYSLILESIRLGHYVPSITCFEKEIIYKLRQMSIHEISNLPDVSEGLEFSIKKAVNSCNTIVEFMHILKSKRYTATRLQRILLYALLDITKLDIEMSKNANPYVRVLGFNENGKYLLSEISKVNPKLPIITSVKKFVDTSFQKAHKNLQMMLNKDIQTTNIYTLGYKQDSFSNLDFTHKIIDYRI